MHADLIVDETIRAAHADAKEVLGAEIVRFGDRPLDAALPSIGFARRMTPYKRPELLFSDLDRLREIAHGQPNAAVLAGKAHPKDEEGKQSIARLHSVAPRA